MELTLQQISAMPDDSYIYVDVRSEIAYQHGHIANAVHWNGIDNILFPENKRIIVYCTYGENSVPFVKKMRTLGHDAYNLSGGYREWLIHNSEELSDEEINRCASGIIGDDIASVTQEFQDRGQAVYPIETPGFAGDSNLGYGIVWNTMPDCL